MKSFLESFCIKNNFAKYIFYYFKKLAIYLFTFFVLHIKEHVLHNFTKHFSGTRVNQIVNKCFNV